MVFCNRRNRKWNLYPYNSHNPYFNRWFSAMDKSDSIAVYDSGHNPYFNRWFSAITHIIT